MKYFFNLKKDVKQTSFKRSDVISTNGTFIPTTQITKIDDAFDFSN